MFFIHTTLFKYILFLIMYGRKRKLAERLGSLRAESEEIWKSLEAAEKTLLEMVNCNDYDATR